MSQPILPDRDELQRELTEFTYRVSHDFSAPLRAVTEFSRLIKEDYSDKLDKTGLQYLDLIVQAGDKMRAMLEGILIFSRLNTEPGKAEVVALEPLAKSVALPYANQALIHINKLPSVKADAQHMRLLLQALVDNAVKFVARGTQPKITVSAEQKGAFWAITVKDNGIGIEKDFHEDIFMVFKRLHKESIYPGLGLGLALAQKIARIYGGTIAVTSAEGQGSTFTVTLPAA